MENHSPTICVVEDNKPIRRLYCTLLKKASFHTEEFNDGYTAMEWLKNNKADAVIIDILLPDMNGTELLNFIRQQTMGNTIPVIASTGFAGPSDRYKYMEMGFDSYMPKPVNTETFVEDIKKVIDEKKAG